MPKPQCMTDNGNSAQARAYPVSDARDPRLSSAKNGATVWRTGTAKEVSSRERKEDEKS